MQYSQAGHPGFEPGTCRLTVGRSAVELVAKVPVNDGLRMVYGTKMAEWWFVFVPLLTINS